MMQLPPGFDIASLVNDFTTIGTFVYLPIVALTGFYLYKKVISLL